MAPPFVFTLRAQCAINLCKMKLSHYFCLMACGLTCASLSIAAGEKESAFDCYLRAAKSGQPEAQYRLALMYREGSEAEKDFEEYLWWLNKAAEAGHVTAQFELAARYQMGGNLDETPQEEDIRNQLAAKWYRRAAEQGHVDAQWIMGVCYYCGIGVPESATEAAKWYRLAAEQGHAKAQCDLGNMYAQGEGVPQSFVEAERWYRRAAAQGEEDAVKALETLPEKAAGEEDISIDIDF